MTEPEDEKPKEQRGGYLVVRMVQGDGIIVDGDIEIRIARIRTNGGLDVQLAVKAPKEYQIKRVR